MPIFDTHAHYDADRFDSDRDALLSAMPGGTKLLWLKSIRVCRR